MKKNVTLLAGLVLVGVSVCGSVPAQVLPNGADLEVRMQELERESAQVNGNVERLGNAVEMLARKLDALSRDMDMRLQDLEKQRAAAAPAVPVAVPAAQPAVPATTAVVTAPAVKPTPTVPAKMEATELYNRAYAYLTAADYSNARVWFETFLKRYPTHPLADSVYYWLGEVYLVENKPTDAVKSFKDGLTAFPKGQKAPANLLKMGVALQKLNQPQLAKGAWAKLVRDYPKSVEASKAKDNLLKIGG